MATSTRHICRSLQRLALQRPTRTSTITTTRYRISQSTLRPFTSIPSRRADNPASSKPARSVLDEEFTGDVLDETEYLTPQTPYKPADLPSAERADYDLMSPADQKHYLKLQNHFKAIFESSESQQELEALATQADREIQREGGPRVSLDFPTMRAKGPEIGYWAEDEEDEFGQMEDADNDWSEENITSVAETELDLHRDVREYTRIAAWDLPLLQQYAKPFSPPNQSTPLRFRYTTYMGEYHPAQHKVVLEFCSRDLLSLPSSSPIPKLTETQRVKLLKLVGPRYNPETDVIKMSCEKFPSAAQNKRHLGELVNNLIKEAKDKRDTFDDVPLDLRHHKQKRRIVYPEAWKLRGETVKKVAEGRKGHQNLLGSVGADGVKELEEVIPVDGRKVVEQFVRAGNVRASNVLPR